MSKKRVILSSVAGIVVAAAVGGFLYFQTLDEGTAVKEDKALTDFRASKAPDGAPRAGLPPQGVYTLAVTGTETITRGPISVTRPLAPKAPMIVRHTPDGFETETRYLEEHTEIARYGFRPDGTILTFAITTLKVGPTGTTKERAWSPALLRFPAEAGTAPGAGAFKSGDLDLKIASKRLPAETVDVAGAPVDTEVFEFAQEVAGEFTGNRTETFWYSPKDNLIVRYKVDSSLKGPTDLDFSADQTLTSLTPQV